MNVSAATYRGWRAEERRSSAAGSSAAGSSAAEVRVSSAGGGWGGGFVWGRRVVDSSWVGITKVPSGVMLEYTLLSLEARLTNALPGTPATGRSTDDTRCTESSASDTFG